MYVFWGNAPLPLFGFERHSIMGSKPAIDQSTSRCHLTLIAPTKCDMASISDASFGFLLFFVLVTFRRHWSPPIPFPFCPWEHPFFFCLDAVEQNENITFLLILLLSVWKVHVSCSRPDA
jgi:hypothetical protein